MNSELYSALNRSWKSTCKILLGEELGELRDYEDWLAEYCPKPQISKSAISGKEVYLASDYSKLANVISADEISTSKPLSINDIKDIDSLVRAVSEEWAYTGNRVLGNSKFVESSDLVMDSNYVANSLNVSESTNVFYSSLIRLGSKNIFGSGWFGKTEFTIRFFGGFNCKRIFESHIIGDCSDLYFSNQCVNSSELMFCFFQRNQKHKIGNVQLSRDKYFDLKKKLLSEVIQSLKTNKKYPSLFELVNRSKSGKKPPISVPKKQESSDMKPIEKSFASTFKIILKKEPGSITEYENWLASEKMKMEPIQTMFGSTTYRPSHPDLYAISLFPKDLFVTLNEGLELGKIVMDQSALGSIDSITSQLGQIAYFSVEILDGVNKNTIQSPLVYYTNNIYKGFDIVQSENLGVISSAFSSKYIFGGYRNMNSEFCINCHNSLYLSRCLEVDTSTKCADALFCHNSEGLTDSMFCFNVKGKRHAIGNTSLPQADYSKIKESVLEQLSSEILQKKNCRFSIFTIGGMK
ncbi:Uncharacterised protein [Candidatus Bilamarchaeum dharawalense]|uniref:Uncharacterized protein n=1 Tax=Candidatus Bilamarchaeum dharawalense TaxID=2885759 RepID=A0A5E4LRJ8_9ARCH|nr:Uncharacterised protein [Candidatus Bilamarchaeum dharawalense]